jgi:hypothetical protein
MLYKELKTSFEIMIASNELPKTLDADHIYYGDVQFTIEHGINLIDTKIKEIGAKVKTDLVAKTTKHGLEQLHESLKDRSKWNAPRPKTNFN